MSRTFAQTTGAGSINGTVQDAALAAIPGATVNVTNIDTGVTHSYVTNAAGLYSAPFLLPGHYKVDATAPNFSKVEKTGITLLVGQTLTIDVAIKVNSTSTTIEVEADSQILDTEKTEVSQVVDQAIVQNLPVNTRNWSSFALLTPNVTQDGGTGLISFHGISGLYNQNYVDGANNNQMLFSEARGRSNGAPYVYSVDSIKEFQTETSNYSVEFGQAAGGQVNAITKSGTNAIHGDIFYYLRYPALNALDPFTKWTALNNTANPVTAHTLLTVPVHQQQQFGGSVGGPIMKDKLFYFFTYDGFRKVGKVLYTESNWLSTSNAGAPTSISASNTINPAACPTTYLTATQCLAGINFLINQSITAPGRYAKEDVFFPRLDYHINSKNDAFVDFNFANFSSTNGYSAGTTFSNSSPSTNGPAAYHERFLVGGWTMQIGNSSVNDLHGQWGRDLETAGASAAAPNVGMGAVSFGMPNALPRFAEPDEKRIQISDVFSTSHGRHTFKFGGDVNIVHEVMINLFQGGGLYSYGESTNLANFKDWIRDAFAGQNADPYAGYYYKQLIQTVDLLNTAPGTQGKDDFWMKMYDGFGEDIWKVRPNLTLTLGARYDIQLTPSQNSNEIPNASSDNGLFANFQPIAAEYTANIKNVTDRIQPRVAFSWSPFVGTVVRGGYGLFSALNQGSTYYAQRVENGAVQLNYTYLGCYSSVKGDSTTPPNTKCPTPPGTGSTPAKLRYPNLPFTPAGPSLSGALYPAGGAAPAVTPITTAPSYSFHGLDPNFVPPFAHEFDLSVEQALPGKISLQVGYVGTRGMRLPVFIDANLIGQKPSGMGEYYVQDSSNNVLKTITVPVYLSGDRRNTSLSSFNTGFSVANTWYNSMAVTVRRPFSNGLEVLGNFTWAKATDTGQVGGANGTFYGGDTPSDPNNIRFDNGPSDIDIRNRGSVSFIYHPTVNFANAVAREVVNGWQISGTEVASGGEPIFLGVSGTVNQGGYGYQGGIFGGAISSSSGLPTNGRPPQVGRNSIYAPGFNDLDLRVSREIPIHESIKLQFNVEAFNLLNRRIITGVVSTYSTFVGPGSTASGSSYSCPNAPSPTGGQFVGCFVPYTGTGVGAFGQPSSTSSSNLFGPRQLQVSTKLFF